jgi:hypothetical protein
MHALQASPVLPLQLADFNGDGLTDLILVSSSGLYGWAQARAQPSFNLHPCLPVDPEEIWLLLCQLSCIFLHSVGICMEAACALHVSRRE